jgi:hypothetical protein
VTEWVISAASRQSLGSDTWSGLGTGIVTAVISGLVTGVVAIGLFYRQRHADRQRDLDQRTADAIGVVRGVADKLTIDLMNADREKRVITAFSTETGPFYVGLLSERPRIDSDSVSELVTQALEVLMEYTERVGEIAAAHPDAGQDGDGNDVVNRDRVGVQRRVMAAFITYLGKFSDTIALWSPSRRDISPLPDVPDLIAKRYQPGDGER